MAGTNLNDAYNSMSPFLEEQQQQQQQQQLQPPSMSRPRAPQPPLQQLQQSQAASQLQAANQSQQSQQSQVTQLQQCNANAQQAQYQIPKTSASVKQPISQMQAQGLSNPVRYISNQRQFNNVGTTVQEETMQQREYKPLRFRSDEPSYFDLLASKKKDMGRILVYALMILLALVVYTLIDVIIKEVLIKYDLSFKQEVGMRLVYSVVIIFIIWNMKICS